MPMPSDCQRCNGTGVYNGTRRDGSTYSGPCFACQGGAPRYRRGGYRPAPVRTALVATPTTIANAPVYTPRQQASLDAFAVAQPMAWVWLVNNRATSDFAASLLNGIARYGNLTPRQLACVMRNVGDVVPVPPASMPSDAAIGFADPIPTVDAGAPGSTISPTLQAMARAQWAREANDPTMVQRATLPDAPPPLPLATVEPVAPVQPIAPSAVNLDRVRTAMESARASGLRKVRLTFGNVTMRLSGPSFRLGAGLILCYHNGTYCGSVDASNNFRARFGATVTEESLNAFRAVGVDPQAAARTHGNDTGNCSCCRRLLTDPPSVMAGIGPVCIRRFGWSF